MVVHVGAARAQQQEEEAHGHGYLQHRVQLYRLPQPHEGHGGPGEELHAAWGCGTIMGKIRAQATSQPPARGSTERGRLATRPPAPKMCHTPRHTHKDHCGLSVLGDLLQQLQLMLGLRASDACWWGWRRQLALGAQRSGAQPSLLAAVHPGQTQPRPGCLLHSPLAPHPVWFPEHHR